MKWLIILPILVVAIIVTLSIYLQPNSFIGCGTVPNETTGCTKADAIVVVSGGDTEARTQAGIDLYKNGWGDSLVLSGAAQDKTGPSNAAAMKQQAVEAGIPETSIYIDEEAANTQQNAKNTKSIFTDNNMSDIILVTSGYHQRRASLEFHKLSGDSITIRNSPVLQDKDWGWYWWLTPRGWWLAGTEIVKVGAFHLGATS